MHCCVLKAAGRFATYALLCHACAFPSDCVLTRRAYPCSGASREALAFPLFSASTPPLPARRCVFDTVAAFGGASDTCCGCFPDNIVSVSGSNDGVCDLVEKGINDFRFRRFQAECYREQDHLFFILTNPATRWCKIEPKSPAGCESTFNCVLLDETVSQGLNFREGHRRSLGRAYCLQQRIRDFPARPVFRRDTGIQRKQSLDSAVERVPSPCLKGDLRLWRECRACEVGCQDFQIKPLRVCGTLLVMGLTVF